MLQFNDPECFIYFAKAVTDYHSLVIGISLTFMKLQQISDSVFLWSIYSRHLW
jgi:hypothetical protein